jgi:hypothetical protein
VQKSIFYSGSKSLRSLKSFVIFQNFSFYFFHVWLAAVRSIFIIISFTRSYVPIVFFWLELHAQSKWNLFKRKCRVNFNFIIRKSDVMLFIWPGMLAKVNDGGCLCVEFMKAPQDRWLEKLLLFQFHEMLTTIIRVIFFSFEFSFHYNSICAREHWLSKNGNRCVWF